MNPKLTSPKFSSLLTQILLDGRKKSSAVVLPANECFRVNRIFSEHEYGIDPRYLPTTPITVVDIGANVGVFTLYMVMNYSVGTIHCFEPAPASLELLRHNTAGFNNIFVHPCGMMDKNGSDLLVLHPRNSGENRIARAVMDDGAETVRVKVCDASVAFGKLGLTYIDVLKIDTEGCEVPILRSLKPRLDYVGIVLIEYHSEADRRRIDGLLSGFKLFGAKAESMDVGILKYINRRLLPKG